MKYNAIGITIGTHCNAECSICCMSEGERNRNVLDISILKKYIKSTVSDDRIKAICFTGGEAFLYHEYLKKLIMYTKECNKKCGVISNGYWGTDYDHALKVIEELSNCGLNYLTLSYDEFHSEYIPVHAISNILKISKTLNLDVSIQSVLLENTKINSWLSKLGSSIKDIKIDFVPCMPVGNAKRNFDERLFIREYEIEGLKCRKGGSYSIGIDGIVWPCCSPYVTETALIIDNISMNPSIEFTFNRLKKNVILFALRNYGFDFFTDIAINELGMKLPEKYTSSCELCSILFNADNIMKFIPFVQEKIIINTIR